MLRRRRYSWDECIKAGGIAHLDMWPGDSVETSFGHWTMTTTGHMVFTPGRA
jgi:hypothetical protein